jgi:hypothetical protein
LIVTSVCCNNVSFSVLDCNVYKLKYYFSFFLNMAISNKDNMKYISFLVRNRKLFLACYNYWDIKPIWLFRWCFKSRGFLSIHVNVVVDSSSLVSERFECQHSPVLATMLRAHSISQKVFLHGVKPLPDYVTHGESLKINSTWQSSLHSSVFLQFYYGNTSHKFGIYYSILLQYLWANITHTKSYADYNLIFKQPILRYLNTLLQNRVHFLTKKTLFEVII